MTIKIDPEFKALIPPLAPEELAQLEANIIKDGCRDPLVTWGKILLDGHNRLKICQKHGIEFETVGMEFADREAAMDWMDANQLGRRNLSPDQRSIMRGRRYNRTKKTKAEAEAIGGASKSQNATCLDNATALAKEHKVHRATIIRDGKRAEAVEKLAETNPEAALHRFRKSIQLSEAFRLAKTPSRKALGRNTFPARGRHGMISSVMNHPPHFPTSGPANGSFRGLPQKANSLQPA